MRDETESQADEENSSTVGTGRVDNLFDDIEETIEQLDGYADELISLRNRIEANEDETSAHVRDHVNEEADRLGDDAAEAADRLSDELQNLKEGV